MPNEDRTELKTQLTEFVEAHSLADMVGLLAEICGEKSTRLRRDARLTLAKPWRATERKLRRVQSQAEV